MKKMGIIIMVLCLGGCVSDPVYNSMKIDINNEERISNRMSQLRSEQMELIDKKSPMQEVINKNSDGAAAHQEFRGICKKYSNDTYNFKFYSSCMDIYGLLGGVRAEMMLSTGKYAAELGKKEDAKQIFRDIVTNFTGEAYKSQVKKAEFALQDLK